MLSYNTLIVLLGATLLSTTSGVVGALAVLRRRALTGDALAHAALPGVWLGFLLAGAKSLPLMLGGALAAGLAGVVVISWLPRATRIREDAAIGSVLGVFFGCGVALESYVLRALPTSQKAGASSFLLGKAAAMTLSDVVLIGLTAAVCLTAIVLLYKEFKLTSFDPGFGAAIGWPVGWIDLALLALVAAAVIASLPAVGVVLAAAVLILPGAAARFWTQRLGWLLAIAGLFGAVMGGAGALGSALVDRLPTGPVVVLVGSVLFAISLGLGPVRGLLSGAGQRSGQARQWEEQNLLRQLAAGALPRPAQARAAARLAARGWLNRLPGGDWRLTSSGAREAARLTQNYLIWEAITDAYPELAAGDDDPYAERSHSLPPELYADLVARLQAAGRWPAAQGGGP